jgi:hypothetical protein
VEELAPFYVRQIVVAVDAHPQSKIKNGQLYTITSVDYCESGNPPTGKKYWYVGVTGHHNRLRPSIFAPFNQNFQPVSLKNILELETPLISQN